MALTRDVNSVVGNGKPMVMFSNPAQGVAVLQEKITFDSSYPTGGETLDLRPFFSTLLMVMIEPVGANYKFVYDYTNRKVIAYIEDGTSGVHAEVANNTDLSAISTSFAAWGIAALDKK